MTSQSKGRIVLYHPQIADARKGRAAGMHVLPLSLLHIAAWPKADGYEVIIIDGDLYDDPDDAHKVVVDACEGAFIYGTTGMVGFQVSDGFYCTEKVRARYPKINTIVGGWWASVVPEMQLETGIFDAVCLGQGEITFREYVLAVDSGEPLEQVAGLALWRDGKTIFTDHRSIVGWDKLLNAAWDVIDFEPYRNAQLSQIGTKVTERMPRPDSFTENRPVVTMVYHASFGCPEPCAFCCSPEVTDRRWKAMPADRMLDDIGELSERWDFDVIRFYDANWGVNEKRVKEFSQGKLDRGLDFHYLSLMEPFSILRYKPETLDLLAESGCYVVNLGAEAGSNEMMEKIGKHTVDDDNLNTALELDKRGIDAWMTYIIGYPGEDRKSMYATIDQARRVRAASPRAHPWVWIYQPIPGTPMYRQAIAEGFVPPKTLIEWGNFGEYHVSETWPNRIPQDVLEYRQLYQHFLTLSEGLTRNKIGWWERRAQRRLQTGDWRLGARVEAKAYDIYHKLTQHTA